MVVALLCLAVLAVAYPFAWMISTVLNLDASFSIPNPFKLIPDNVGLDSLTATWKSVDVPRLYINSFVVTAGEIVFSVSSALLSGYALSKIRFAGAKIVLLVALSTMMMPPGAAVIPSFMLIQRLGLLDSYWALWLTAIPYVLGTFLCKQYFDSIPDSFREAAQIDGASELRIFWQIYVPLAMPVIATLTILKFLGTWNELLWPLLVLNDPDKYTIQVGMAVYLSLQGAGLPPGLLMAAAFFTMLPVMVIYLFFQRLIIETVAQSGIRG